MKIGFIYNSNFTITTALQQPISDARTAVSALAIELLKIGHDVTVFSNTEGVADALGVRNRNVSINAGALNIDKVILEPDFDALVVVNDSPDFINGLRKFLPYTPKFYLWTNFDFDMPANNAFNKTNALEAVQTVICVSNWQRESMMSKFYIPEHKLAVMTYAIAPCYENLYLDAKEFAYQKDKNLSFAYLGKPKDGLEVLLDLYDEIRFNFEDINLSIYCDLNSNPDLMARQAQNKNVVYMSKLSQRDLIQNLRKNNILAFPSSNVATSNVFLSEAMACGLFVITSNTGSIPEYCYGHGRQLALRGLKDNSLSGFSGELLNVCQTLLHSPGAFYDYCYKQVLDLNRNHTWRVRARDFLNILSSTTD